MQKGFGESSRLFMQKGLQFWRVLGDHCGKSKDGRVVWSVVTAREDT